MAERIDSRLNQDQRQRERPQFYQVQDPRFKNDTVDTWNSQNVPSSQDQLAVPGYPYSDAKSESAARVVGDNEGWHVVGDSSGTPVGEGAAPSGRIGHGVHPQGQGPVDNTQADVMAPEAGDVQSGYYTDHYGRQIPVNTGTKQVGGGVAPGSGTSIGQGIHPQGEQPASRQQQTGGSIPQASDVQSGYYTDHYDRQIPVGGVKQVGTGAAPQPGVPLNQQEIVSYPDASRQLNVGSQGEQTGQHLARLHRPTIVKDEFGTIYHPTIVNGQVHYIPEKDHNQIVRPNPRLVSDPRIADMDNDQWRRQQEHMRIAEEERRLQEQAVRDRWANEQNKGQKEDWKPVARTDEVKPENVGQHETEQEDPVPYENDDEEPAAEQPAKLPTPRENPEEVAEDDEDDV